MQLLYYVLHLVKMSKSDQCYYLILMIMLTMLIHKPFPHTQSFNDTPASILPFPPFKRKRLILSSQLPAVEPLSQNTTMLQTAPHTACHLSPSPCKLVNSSIPAIIKAFWLITPFNWPIPVAWAKWYLVSSAAEKTEKQTKGNTNNIWGVFYSEVMLL